MTANQQFLGSCCGVRLTDRGPCDKHQLVVLMIEDDGMWHDKMTISNWWLDELIDELKAARAYLRATGIKTKDGHKRK